MAGSSDIIAYGFGSWSTVAKVPTHGFGIGTVTQITVFADGWFLDSIPDWAIDDIPDWTIDEIPDWTVT